MKNQKAITLIALIITIIVLLILAGVTINMVLGENGIVNKSKSSVAKYENAQEKENSVLAGYENKLDEYINSDRNSKFTLTTLWEYDSTVSGENVKSGIKTGELVLSHSITDFDEIAFIGQYYENTSNYNQTTESRMLTATLLSNPPYLNRYEEDNWNFSINHSTDGEKRRMVFNLVANDKIFVVKYDWYRLLKIIGINY